MALIGRIVVILFAVMLASLAAGVAVAIGIFGPQWHSFSGDVPERVFFWGTVLFASVYAGFAGLLPTAILIALAETFKIRSAIVYAIAGALLFLTVWYTSGLAPASYEESIDHPPPPVSRAAELAAAAGAVFGLSYWLLAGRNAGRWREKRAPAA